MEKELINAVLCWKCGDFIESAHRHDYKICSCGQVAVDGGHDYRRRGFQDTQYEEII